MMDYQWLWKEFKVANKRSGLCQISFITKIIKIENLVFYGQKCKHR